jgi:hypothetical protein
MMRAPNSQILSVGLEKMKTDSVAGSIEDYIPIQPILDYKEKAGKMKRERVYTLEFTLTGMLYQASQEDKSQQNAVLMLSQYHQAQLKQAQQEVSALQKAAEQVKSSVRPRGRPKRIAPAIPISKTRPISLNTGSYNEATSRMPLEVMENTFMATTDWFHSDHESPKWHGRDVYATDGIPQKQNP